MPQLPQSYVDMKCQINGTATKTNDPSNISQSAKGAEEDGAAPLPSPTEAGGLTECPAQDVTPGALVRHLWTFLVVKFPFKVVNHRWPDFR